MTWKEDPLRLLSQERLGVSDYVIITADKPR
jgi:hypothetical protein